MISALLDHWYLFMFIFAIGFIIGVVIVSLLSVGSRADEQFLEFAVTSERERADNLEAANLELQAKIYQLGGV